MGFYRKPGNDANNRGKGGQSCSLRHYDALHTKINMWYTPKNLDKFFL